MALGNVVARLLVRLGLDKNEFDSGSRQAQTQAKGLARSLNDVRGSSDLMTGALKTAGVLGVAYIAKEAAGAVWELGKLGAQSLRLSSSFKDLASQAGGSADDILAALRRATSGTVSEMDMILAVNKGVMLGLGAQADQWEELAEVARYRARAMGISMTQALDDITTGLGRMQPLILDNLGITVDSERVYGEYAQSIGKVVSKLSEAEKKQALMNEVIKVGQGQIEAAGGIADDQADKFEAMTVAIENLKVSLATELAPAITWLAGEITKLLGLMGFDPGEIITWESMAEDAKKAGKGVDEAAQSMMSAYGQFGLNEEQIITLSETYGVFGLDIKALADRYRVELTPALIALIAATSGQEARFRNIGKAVEDVAGDVMTLAEAIAGPVGLIASLQAVPERVFALLPKELQYALEYSGQLQDSFWKDAIQTGVDAWYQIGEEGKDTADETAQAWQNAYDEMASTITAALTPTSVTPLDMGLSGMGEYVEKWDENARRLDAIAARGFAELEAHPDWAALLQIPENVLAVGEDALKSWASQTAADVRDLFRPDLLNVTAAADAVEAYMREQAAKELSIDLVIGELVARGDVSKEDAEKQVRQAYGLETEAIDVPINLVSALAGDEGGAWDTAAADLFKGLTDGMTDSSLALEFVSYFKADITNKEGDLKGAGEALWNTVELGIYARLDKADYATLFVSKLGPLVGTWLLEQGFTTQGQGPT